MAEGSSEVNDQWWKTGLWVQTAKKRSIGAPMRHELCIFHTVGTIEDGKCLSGTRTRDRLRNGCFFLVGQLDNTLHRFPLSALRYSWLAQCWGRCVLIEILLARMLVLETACLGSWGLKRRNELYIARVLLQNPCRRLWNVRWWFLHPLVSHTHNPLGKHLRFPSLIFPVSLRLGLLGYCIEDQYF